LIFKNRINLKLERYTDNELFVLSKSSKKNFEKVCKEFYRRHAVKINHYCIKVTGRYDESADLLQDTFIKFFEKIKQHDTLDNIYGYLFTICRNKCIDFQKKQNKTVSLDELENTLIHRDDDSELIPIIDRSLDLLSNDDKELFIMKIYRQMDYKDIAEIKSMTVAAVKNRVYRARKQIRNVLSPYINEIKG
jgi:RNA polymerase sigma-70 factor (ECF subfamily)